ncbi:MAG: LamG domain-containing protein [Planctomycetota bacterium]|jgi:hypothetical protein
MRKEMIFALAVIFSLSFANFVLAINDPVAHWKLDEGTGMIAEDSAGDNDGNLINGPNWTTGIIGEAIEFDGVDDYVDVNSVGELNFERTDAYTLSAWYKGDVENHAILSKMDTPVIYRGYDMYIFSGYVRAHILNSWPSNAICETGTLYPISDSIWHHIVITYDGSSSSNGLKIYVDGMEEITTVNVDSLSSTIQNSVSFKIAARGGTRITHHLGGTIDDVRIYDRALSAEEIQWLYLGEEPELVGLEITGPDEVPEDSQAQYSAIALYDNNSTADVTDDAVWSVEPNEIAGIEAGLLATEKIFQPQELEIYAQYTEDGNTFEADKAVSVFAICPSGSALDFDGVDDYVDCKNTFASVTASDTKSIMAWVKPDSAAEAVRLITLYRRSDSSSAFALRFDGTPATWSSLYMKSPTSYEWLDSGVQVSAGEWTHIALVQNGTQVDIYVNGISENSASNGAVATLSSPPNAVLGAYMWWGHHPSGVLNGLLDDVRIYDRAVSAQEMQMIMHVPLDGNEPNLVGYWDFDEGEGQVAHDTSGNGNDGQLGTSADIDDSDPNWVDSDAPVGICTLQELLERNVNEALEIKLNILDEILEALAREDSSLNILDGLFGELDYGYLDKSDIRRVRQKIHSAIQSEEQATGAIEKSIEKLDISLNALDGE